MKLKKLLSLILLLIVVFCVSCTKESTYYTVTVMNGDETFLTFKIAEGKSFDDCDLGIDPISYDIDGYYLNGEKYDTSSSINSDLVLTATITDKEYKIVFKDEDGRVIRSRSYYAYEDIEAPSNPYKQSDINYDYTFAGWNQEFKTAICDMEIVATYTKTDRLYEVKIEDANGVTIDTINLKRGSKIDFPTNMTKESDSMYNYTFKCWVDEDGNKYDENVGTTGKQTFHPIFTTTPNKHDTTNMIVSMVGDSISTFYKEGQSMISYYSEKDTYYYPMYGNWIQDGNDTWWGITINNLKAKLGINNSWSGSTCYNWGSKENKQAACNDYRLNTLAENGEPDIIIVYIGTNDNVNGFTLAQFEGAYSSMITKIHNKYKTAYVFCMTMGYCNSHYASFSQDTRIQYNQIIKDICENQNCTVIDIATIQTEDTYDPMMGDTLHYSKIGMQTVGAFVTEEIQNYFKESK